MTLSLILAAVRRARSRPSSRASCLLPALRATAIATVLLGALSPGVASAQFRLEPRDERFWLLGGAALTASLVFDARLSSFAQRIQTPSRDRFAHNVGSLGQTQYALSALAVGVIVPRVFGNRSLSKATLRVAAGYGAALVVVNVLKPLIGRDRPDSGGRPGHFRPFSSGGSMPSGHATTAFALASGLAIQTKNPWVTWSAYTLASLVGAQRVYGQAHWASDVVVGGVLSMAATTTIVRWLERSGGSLGRR